MGPRPAEHGPDDPGGVDLYVGGVEHAVLHLLYSRFWHKVLYDLGHVSSREPYRRLVNQGYIQAFAYTDARGSYVPAAEVVERDGKFYWPGPDGEIEVNQEFGKIGKSLKNSVSPDEICEEYGADTLRVYEMSMGPLEASRPWATKDVVGAYRFLQRVWRAGGRRGDRRRARVADARAGRRDAAAAAPDHRRGRGRLCGAAQQHRGRQADRVHQPPHQGGRDRSARGGRAAGADGRAAGAAPGRGAVAAAGPRRRRWRTARSRVADPAYLVEDTVEYPVQVNGKVRGRVTVAADADADALEAAALADEKVQAFLAGATPEEGHRGRRAGWSTSSSRAASVRPGRSTTSWTLAVARRRHRVATAAATVSGRRNLAGSYSPPSNAMSSRCISVSVRPG